MIIEWSRKITLEPYRILYDTDTTINLVWGGRDSGKSFAIPQILTRKALNNSKFRCMLIRKNLNTVKNSMFDRFNNMFDKYNFHSIVNQTKTPLEIKLINGADFLGRGCDDAHKIKSTTDPSDAWIEEANEITEHDFDIILTTLRSNYVKVQIWLTFNPEVYKNGKSWIRERFFKGMKDSDFEKYVYGKNYEFNINVEREEGDFEIKCLSIHTTADCNPYADTTRIATYDAYKQIDINKYNVWRLGKWGHKQIESPFAWAFNSEMIQEKELDYDLPVDISFDFNVAPCTATISQQSFDRMEKNFLYEIRVGTKDQKSNIYGVCEVINKLIPQGLSIRITGDASGTNKSAMVYDNVDAYDIICEQLNLPQSSIYTPKKNPLHKDSYYEFNDRLKNRKVTFHPRMVYSIEDLKQVEYLNGNIEKKKAEDKGMGHLLDCMRYDINTFFY